jgi:segregation and condensation protein A
MTERTGFEVHLENFTGPFDLLLSLISKHQLDVTEVALARVSDEFVSYIRELEGAWDLDEASEFLVVAATLLNLKAARLLPQGETEDEEDIALLEARDLLFARLLQYRAYKQVAAWIGGRMEMMARSYPRAVALEEPYASLLPEVVLGIGPEALAAMAARAMLPKPKPELPTDHVHAPPVNMAEQQAIVVERLHTAGTTTFRALAAGAPNTLVVVARFLVLLDLYVEAKVSFEQLVPLGELTVRWMS